MLLFSQRRKLAELYKKWWLKQTNIRDCPLNVIGYLVGNGLINEEAALAFLERAEKEEVD